LSIFVVKDGKRILPRSFYVKILIFLGLIGLSVVTMQPLQALIIQKFQDIRDNLIHEMETITGMEIHYASIRPSFINSLEIRSLGFSKEGETLFSAAKIAVNFSIVELLMNKKAFIHTVLIDRPLIKIDMEKDKDVLDKLLSLLESDEKEKESDMLQKISQYFPSDANYRIQNGSFFLINKDSIYSAENINLNIREEEDKIFIAGNLSGELKQGGLFEKTMIIRTDLSINGSSDSNLQNGKASVSFNYINCLEQEQFSRNESFFYIPVNNENAARVLFSVLPFNIDLIYDDSGIKFFQHDETGNSFHFQYNLTNENINASVNLDNLKITDKISFSDHFVFPRHLLDINISGNSSIKLEDGKVNFNADFNGGNFPASHTAPLTDAFTVVLSADNQRINVRNFSICASENTAKRGFFQGRIGFSGYIGITPLRPFGTLSFNRFSLSGNDDLNANFNINSRASEINITAENVEAAQAQIENIDINIYPSQKDVSVLVSVFSKETGIVFMDAVYSKNPRHMEASFTLDEMSIFELTEMFRPFTYIPAGSVVSRTFLQNSKVSTDIFFSTDFINMIYNAPSINFNLGETEGMLSISGTDRKFILSEGVFKNKENDFLVSANVDFSNPLDLNFIVNANYLDLAWNVDGQVLDRTTLIVRDPNGLYIYGNIDNSGGLSGYIEGIDFPIPAGSQHVNLNFYSTVRFSSIDFWNLDISRFTASGLETGDYREFLRVSGSADQDGASFREILYYDNVGILAGSADFSWDNDFSYLEFIVNITDGYEGGEYYNLEGSLKDEKISLRAAISNMHINRFVNSLNPVTISGDVNLIWESIDSFNAQINLASLKTRVNYELMNASVGMVFNNDELLVRNLHLDYGGIKSVLPELQVSRTQGFAKTRADISGSTLYKDIEASIQLNAHFEEIASWFEIAQIINNFSGTLLIRDVQYGNLRQERFVFEFSGVDRAISINGGINDMLRLEMDNSGNFFLGLSAPMPVRGTFVGTLKEGILDSSCNNFFIDLSALYSMTAPDKDFNISGGYITGQMDIRGPLINPEFFGSGIGTSMRLMVPNYLGDEIKVVPFTIIAEGYEMSFGPASVLCGLGGGNVKGWLFFQNWAPINVGLDINIPRESPVPYDFNITGFLANGNASGNLNLTLDGINQLFEFTGSLFTNDAEMGINVEDMASLSEETGNQINSYVELTITTGSKVEFIWPITNPIIRANPELGTVIHVSSDTAAGQFSINSDIKVRSGELYYLDRSYFIRQGNLVLRENETQFNPKFSTRAEIRERTETGPVTISLIVENQPLLSFQPRFEASPSLTQLEIYSILGQNFNTLEGGEDATDQMRLLVNSTDLAVQLLLTSDVFAQVVFLRQFERLVRDSLGLDMFSFRSKFVQNFVITGAGINSQSANNSGQGQFGNYFDNTTVFIGKYIGQHMFVSSMLTVRYDENSNILGGLRLEPDIGIELQSPFLNIRWDLFPSSPDNPLSWVTDNSITLSWSMSF